MTRHGACSARGISWVIPLVDLVLVPCRVRRSDIDGRDRVDRARRCQPRRRWIAAFSPLIVLIALLAPARAARAAFDVRDTTWEGCSQLLEIAREELGVARVHPVAVLDWSQLGPDDGVLVLHPHQALDPDETTAFMKAGGRLAIVDDFGRGEDTLRRFQIERTTTPARPVAALRNRPALAIAEPVVDVVGGHSVGPHPVASHVQRLVTNHATGLRHPNLSPVLRIRAIGEPDVVIAVAGQVGKGRLFAMSDPSALMNMMLRYPGNRAFASGLSRYLVDEDGAEPRKGRLYIVTNQFEEKGAFGGETSLRKELDAHVRAAARAVEDARRDGLPSTALLALAALAGVGLALWTSRTSAKPYRSPLPRYARPTPLIAQGGAAGRFAVLAAPSSPRGLAFLELKSALFEALAARFGLDADPTPELLAQLVSREGSLDERSFSAFKEVLAAMHRIEASVVAGRPANVSRSALAHAAGVVREVLAACGADGRQPPRRRHTEGLPGAEMARTQALPAQADASLGSPLSDKGAR